MIINYSIKKYMTLLDENNEVTGVIWIATQDDGTVYQNTFLTTNTITEVTAYFDNLFTILFPGSIKVDSTKSYYEGRNNMINLLSGWATMSNVDKKIFIENYVYPNGTTTAELDALYTQAQRDSFRDLTMEKLNSDTKALFSVWRDTDGTFYKVTVDGGVTTKSEITTYQIL